MIYTFYRTWENCSLHFLSKTKGVAGMNGGSFDVKRLFQICILGLLWALASGGRAKLVPIPIPELVKNFDLAVVGTLADVHKTARWGGIVDGTATLRVREVIYGDTTSGAVIPVEWFFMEGSLPDCDISRFTGEHIYLFNLNSGKLDNLWLQGMLDLSRRGEIEAATSNPLRMRYRSSLKPLFQVDIGYQNGTSQTMVLPEIVVTSTTLVLPPGAALNIVRDDSQDSSTFQLRPGSIISATTATQITLPPNSSKYVRVDLEQLYAGKLKDARLNWTLPPYGQSNAVRLYHVVSYPGKVTPDDFGAEAYPLWDNLRVLFKYPSGGLIAGTGLLAAVAAIAHAIWWFRRRGNS